MSDGPGPEYRISFCMTCMGRLAHVSETLPFAAKENPEADIQFVLVDYNSPDGLEDWVLHNAPPHLSERLRYVRVRWPPSFHMAHAKNIAHRAATGEILVNLDADNFATHSYTQAIRSAFAAGHDLVRFDPGDPRVRGGGSGRIAVSQRLFDRITGYDEAMCGWGYEDTDFVDRARLAGARLLHISADLLNLIRHDDTLRLSMTGSKNRHESESRNRQISAANLRRNVWAVNEDRPWGRA